MRTDRISSLILGCGDLAIADPYDAERSLPAGTLEDLTVSLENALNAVYMVTALQRAGQDGDSRRRALSMRATRDFQRFCERQRTAEHRAAGYR